MTFEREIRYIVIKRKHLTEMQERTLMAWLDTNDIPTIESAVVEADWPENQIVWDMIEKRVAQPS